MGPSMPRPEVGVVRGRQNCDSYIYYDFMSLYYYDYYFIIEIPYSLYSLHSLGFLILTRWGRRNGVSLLNIHAVPLRHTSA